MADAKPAAGAIRKALQERRAKRLERQFVINLNNAKIQVLHGR
jgi:hypothetical protein